MSSNKKDFIKQHSGMTPSIITTINNTSPTPPVTTNTNSSITNNNNGNQNSKSKRPVEPFYESYIEDSFVGHWENEDDDLEDELNEGRGGEDTNGTEEDESALHPSTIEFDFDSFGPESFIYTPNPTKQPTAGPQIETADAKLETKVLDVEKLDQENIVQVENLSTEINENTTVINEPTRLCALNPNPYDHLVDNAQIDLKVIEPYKKVISHAGYCHHYDPSIPAPKPGELAPAIIVFSACYLPDRSRRDYNYVMDHLFLYVLSSLHELIADDYILIYLHNTQPSTSASSISSKTSSSSTLASASTSSNPIDDQHQNNLPTFSWMKRCYQMIDRKLRKNLKILYLVKPTFWLKTIVIMCKPFISSKFSKKLRFVESMDGLRKCLPVDKLILPASAENI